MHVEALCVCVDVCVLWSRQVACLCAAAWLWGSPKVVSAIFSHIRWMSLIIHVYGHQMDSDKAVFQARCVTVCFSSNLRGQYECLTTGESPVHELLHGPLHQCMIDTGHSSWLAGTSPNKRPAMVSVLLF